jgi:DNA-directed RNA polymerase specialized sigma24 family protein
MELSDTLYQHLRKIILGMAINLKVPDPDEALSEMNEVIAGAIKKFDATKMPTSEDALEKYIILCVRRRLINYLLRTNKLQRQNISIELLAQKPENNLDDPTIMTRFNMCLKFLNTILTQEQQDILKRLLIGENVSEISKSMKRDRIIIAREKKYILSLIKKNL